MKRSEKLIAKNQEPTTEESTLALKVRSIDLPTRFRDFDDSWTRFLGGRFPAPANAMSLHEADRAGLCECLRAHLPIAPNGSISLIARTWSVRRTQERRPDGRSPLRLYFE